MNGSKREEGRQLSTPTVTVLMSCYNASLYLRDAIDSILAQTYLDFEFIVINDGSTDGTSDILHSYALQDDRIVLVEKENTGLADSLNVGLRRARGVFVARMDADDIALPERIATQYTFMSRHRQIGLLGTGCRFLDADGNLTDDVCSCEGDHRQLLEAILHRHRRPAIYHPTVMMRRTVALEAGGYNARVTAAQDIDLWLRLSRLSNLHVIPDALLHYRRHEGSISASRRQTQLINGILVRVCYYMSQAGLGEMAKSSEQQWQELWRVTAATVEDARLDRADAASVRLSTALRGQSRMRKGIRLANVLARHPSLVEALCAAHRWRRVLGQVTRRAIDGYMEVEQRDYTFEKCDM